MVETITDNIEESLVDIPEEYLSYLLYKNEINKKVKKNIEKLGKYEAKRGKWKNDQNFFKNSNRVMRLVETYNNVKTKKQRFNE